MARAIRIRSDRVLLSSLLFTVTLLFRAPDFIRDAAYPKDIFLQDVGFASLANILVGLVVVWTGFTRGYRWAWLVMFTIVCIWAFPVFLLPLFHGTIVITLREWLMDAWHRPGSGRIYVENVVLVSIMAVALLLPLKSFFSKSKAANN